MFSSKNITMSKATRLYQKKMTNFEEKSTYSVIPISVNRKPLLTTDQATIIPIAVSSNSAETNIRNNSIFVALQHLRLYTKYKPNSG